MSDHYCESIIPKAIDMMKKSEALEILNIKESELEDSLKEKYNDIKLKIENLESTNMLSPEDSSKCMNNINKAYEKLKDIVEKKNVQANRNEIERQLLIDSRFRKNTEKSSTNFSIDLDTTLTNVYSLRLNTITIPTTWHVFSNKKANTCLEFVSADPADILCNKVVCIQEGTYSTDDDFITELTSKFGYCIDVTYSNISSRITLTNRLDSKLKIYFYKNNSWTDVCSDSLYKNNNLGWYLGFRDHERLITDDEDNIYIELNGSGNDGAAIVADAPLDISGPKYLVLAVDDFNTNQSNNSIVTLSPNVDIPTLPSYYNAAKNSAAPGGIYLNTNPPVYSEFVCVENKVNTNYPFLHENIKYTGIRTLNAVQLTTINSTIETQQKKNHNFPHTSISNAFAIIPLPPTSDKTIVLGAGDEAGRLYFNPVNINRLHLKLYDDFGRILDINNDWICNILIKTQV